ncbi:type VI secretion system baseplate subunit TssF [Pelistega sp. MC2]|uniref:type VI secretion system baseplate subunit TssF n=1 Tax=Pelistega sp. MC2 TaxID=1720297 RepID=UPI0008DB0776|nr:type VI secretion system baseplate subunit TssF [Pelistega sp. MC2]
MQDDFLDYYNKELAYMHEMGKEFANQYPKIAGRLGMQGLEVADPYVERLMEGFSFLTARIHMKMDAEFPQFTQNLLEVLYPGFTAPTPSMGVVRFEPNNKTKGASDGACIEKNTLLRARIQNTECRFVTGNAINIHPITITSAQYVNTLGDLPVNTIKTLTNNKTVRGVLKVQFKIVGGATLKDLENLDSIQFFLNGESVYTHKLLEMILAHSAGVICRQTDSVSPWFDYLDSQHITHDGFSLDEALLPADARVFHGYRILQEYFACPAKFMFFSLHGLKDVFKKHADVLESKTFELIFLLDKVCHELEGNITEENLQLHCVPVINLFPINANRITVDSHLHEYHVVIDRTKPLDYEVYRLLSVKGAMLDKNTSQEFTPMFDSLGVEDKNAAAYYSIRREPRKISDIASRDGGRSSYLGSEVFIALVDKNAPPFSQDIVSLEIKAMCTNRDVPLIFNTGAKVDFRYNNSIPITDIAFIKLPTRPRAALAKGDTAWRLISHLSLNYLSLLDSSPDEGAQAIRDILSIYAELGDPLLAKQIQSIKHIAISPTYQRMPIPGPIVFGRGVKISVEVDENEFAGISPYLFGAVLNQFFARHVSINMMTELQLNSLQSGMIACWKPQRGGRPSV